MNPLSWLWQEIQWLMGLARPENLRQLVNLGGPEWISYLILWAVVFSETGLLVGFFLPGDSLLFAAGFLASQHPPVFRIEWLFVLLSVAAIVGDAVNYFLGLQMEAHVFERGRLRFVKHEHLLAAKEFYERHGGMAIVLARFAPLVRTFTPFVAGVSRMGYRRFALYNVVGGIAWVTLMLSAGYWLGNIPWVAKHFEQVVLLIVLVSILPLVYGALRGYLARRSRIKAHAEMEASKPAE